MTQLSVVDSFLDRKYDRVGYNCMHFAADVWEAETGQRILDLLQGIVDGPSVSSRSIRAHNRRSFTKLDGPSSPSIAIMQRGRTPPHAGVYLRGRILHLTERGAANQLPHIAALGFSRVGYYRPHAPDSHTCQKSAGAQLLDHP